MSKPRSLFLKIASVFIVLVVTAGCGLGKKANPLREETKAEKKLEEAASHVRAELALMLMSDGYKYLHARQLTKAHTAATLASFFAEEETVSPLKAKIVEVSTLMAEKFLKTSDDAKEAGDAYRSEISSDAALRIGKWREIK